MRLWMDANHDGISQSEEGAGWPLDDMREIYRGSMRLFKRDIDFEIKKVGHRNLAFG